MAASATKMAHLQKVLGRRGRWSMHRSSPHAVLETREFSACAPHVYSKLPPMDTPQLGVSVRRTFHDKVRRRRGHGGMEEPFARCQGEMRRVSLPGEAMS